MFVPELCIQPDLELVVSCAEVTTSTSLVTESAQVGLHA